MVSVNVANLKQELEQLFPGKWLSGGEVGRTLKTGLDQIDLGPSAGLLRRRITEWVGAFSSGKTTVLRSICANWCANGLNVIYIDTSDRLVAADWCFPQTEKQGRFWVLRSSGQSSDQRMVGNRDSLKDSLWACEQLIRSRVFDVVILDMAEKNVITSNFYARLQRALERSKASLIVLRDDDSSSQSASWGANLKLNFAFTSPVRLELGLTGRADDIASILPTIHGAVWKDGRTSNLEVSVFSNVQNRLFAHPQVPDRRSSKARTRA